VSIVRGFRLRRRRVDLTAVECQQSIDPAAEPTPIPQFMLLAV